MSSLLQDSMGFCFCLFGFGLDDKVDLLILDPSLALAPARSCCLSNSLGIRENMGSCSRQVRLQGKERGRRHLCFVPFPRLACQ